MMNAIDETKSKDGKRLLKYVQKYKNEEMWKALTVGSEDELKQYIAPIITPLNDDELAKRFDLVMYNIQLAYFQGTNATKGIKSVIETAEELSKLGTIPEVKKQKYVIEKVMTSESWESADIFDIDGVRESLRDLIKYLQKEGQKIYYTNFKDFIIAEESNSSLYNVNDLKNYRKKVEHYLKEHQDEFAIFKLRNNKKLSKQDITTLENILFKELGSQSDYEKEFGDTPVNKLVRRIVGLDANAANEAFSEFLTNQQLNAKQINFVKMVVDYVVKNRFVEDNRILTEDPFRQVGSIIELFENDIDTRAKLIKTINELKANACEVS